MNMEYEFEIEIYGKKIKVFMQNGFFRRKNFTNILHYHNYSELHTISDGEVTLKVGNKQYFLKKGDMFLINGGKSHKYEAFNENLRTVIFQIQCEDCFEEKLYRINPAILQSTANAIDIFIQTGDAIELKAFLMIICARLFENKKEIPNRITDPEFIISEYFSVKYSSDANIFELADKLGVGTKQASRLVKKYTGNTFRNKLTEKRITMAKLLISENTLSLKEVAEKVGYTSYSGFWRAYNLKK